MATSIEDIITLLREASSAYYNGGTLKMTDAEYDSLLEDLSRLDPDHPYFDEVGAPPTQGAVKLPYPMPSLDKIKPGEGVLQRFLLNTGFVLSEKLDGLSALWDNGRLYLRGDGLVGQEITSLVGLGLRGLVKSRVPIRGELILLRSEGEALGRSWVNGQIHQKTPEAKNISKIVFVAYELMGSTLRRSEQFKWLSSNGFEVPWFSVTGTLTEAALISALQERRRISAYDTDGIVIGLDMVPLRSESTAAKAKNPKDCVAFKMPLADQSAETVVQEVIWAPSAQGYLIPRIRFTPVMIGSAKIEFCTGHNARMIVSNNIGPGAKIVIIRSGDVIPKMARVVQATTASLPSGAWIWDGPETTAVHIKAVGMNNEGLSAKLYYFLKTLEIPGAGPAAAVSLVEAGLTGPAAIWGATSETLSKILGPKSGANLHQNLRKAFTQIDENTLMIASSLMPRGVGDTKLTSLFSAEHDPRKWGTLSPPAGWTSDSFSSFLKEYPTYIGWRTKEIHWVSYPILKKQTTAPLVTPGGEVICMTGFRSKSLEEEACKNGHTVVPNITGKVTLLLIPDEDFAESEKVKTARARGIKIMKRSEFSTSR